MTLLPEPVMEREPVVEYSEEAVRELDATPLDGSTSEVPKTTMMTKVSVMVAQSLNQPFE
jgi:hypothetical protein